MRWARVKGITRISFAGVALVMGFVMVIASALVFVSTLVMTTTCASVAQFDPYIGPSAMPASEIVPETVQGRGGERSVVGGVAFWTRGDPPCEYEKLGHVTWTGAPGRDWREAVGEQVKENGGTSLLVQSVFVEAPPQAGKSESASSAGLFSLIRSTVGAERSLDGAHRYVTGVVVRCVDSALRTRGD